MAKSPVKKVGKRAAAKRRAPSNWRDIFLATLAQTSNVKGAAATARIDRGSVYKARQSEAEFNRKWLEALAEGYDNLEMDLLHRLRIGQLEGGKTQARRKFDNAIAFRLLLAHRESVSRQRALRANEDEGVILAKIDAKLDRMRRRAANANDGQ